MSFQTHNYIYSRDSPPYNPSEVGFSTESPLCLSKAGVVGHRTNHQAWSTRLTMILLVSSMSFSAVSTAYSYTRSCKNLPNPPRWWSRFFSFLYIILGIVLCFALIFLILAVQYLRYCIEPPEYTSWVQWVVGVALWAAPMTLGGLMECAFFATIAFSKDPKSKFLKHQWSLYFLGPFYGVLLSPVAWPLYIYLYVRHIRKRDR